MATMNPNLTDVDTIKSLLAKRDIRVSRSLGQNFLICEEVVEAIGEVAASSGESVTELGPGLGVITQALLGQGLRVRAIEKDDDFAEMLPGVVPPKLRGQLEVVHGDLKEEGWQWPEPFQIVGNIPYNLTGLIVRRLTQLEPAPQQAMLLMQREVGQRLRAQAPDMNLLALAVQLWGRAELLTQVPPHCFWPQPEVASQLLLLTPSTTMPLAEREAIMKIARVAFGQKRKQLQVTLRKGLPVSAKIMEEAFERAELIGTQRPQEVTVGQWRVLIQELIKK